MSQRPDRRQRTSGTALARYAAVWLGVGVAAAALLIVVLRDRPHHGLPPLRHTRLADAARDAGCRIVSADRHRPGNPPAYGADGGPPARAAFYDRSPSPTRLVAALRRGRIVVQYRPGLGRDALDDLRTYRDIVPSETIVTVNTTRMPYRVAAVAWGRILGCADLSRTAIDALRLFRARNVGRGPEAQP